MHKPHLLYEALTLGVDLYGDIHHRNRGILADAIGFTGPNAAIQFSNCLSPLNTDKSLNSQKIQALMDAMGHAPRMAMLQKWLSQWGIKPIRMNDPAVEARLSVTIEEFDTIIDEAQRESNESWSIAKRALSDGVTTMKELDAMLKEATESRDKYDEIICMIERKRAAMREAGDA